MNDSPHRHDLICHEAKQISILSSSLGVTLTPEEVGSSSTPQVLGGRYLDNVSYDN